MSATDAERAAKLMRAAIDGTNADYLPLPEHCEDELARCYTEAHGLDRKYVALWGKWLEWDGARWRIDDTLRSFDLARAVCRARAKAAEKAIAAIASAKTVAAVERLARADRGHAARAEQFDADPLLLNTPAGTIDLRTCELRTHRREDWLTKCTAVGPEHREPRRWREFLKRVTNGDAHLEAYMQRVFGYALTGVTREHAFFFLHGAGANGKSTFLNTLLHVLADYAVVASSETFIETAPGRHPTDLAMLRGARLVIASEVDEGRRWALARIKELTGGDPITARFMRADFFTYLPQFKLCISANHRPAVRTVDEAIRRRLNVIPFTVTIPPSERDPGLLEALREEWGAILSWGLEGCAEWREHGLEHPIAVRTATAEYLALEDIFAQWIEDECELDFKAEESLATLHAAYQHWAERAGEKFLGSKRFSQALAERGLTRIKTKQEARGFSGIRLKLALQSSAGG